MFFLVRPMSGQTEFRKESFPLAKGAYWLYEGHREWQERGPTVHKKKITQRMEVEEVIERGAIVAAVVRGYPTSAPQEKEVLIVVDGLEFYLLPASDSVLSRLRDKNDLLIGLVQEDQIELSLPLMKGKRFCEAEEMTRLDGYYCNVVERQWRQRFKTVEGISGNGEYRVYQIAFRTLPDQIILNFAPGIGITSYEYMHHGTVEHEQLKLVEYHSRAEAR